MAKSEEEWKRGVKPLDSLEKERMIRTWELMERHLSFERSLVLDIGCGQGDLVKQLHHAGAQVTCVDSSSLALNQLQQQLPNLSFLHDALPLTDLNDDHYDIVICTDVIAELSPQDHRLAVAELARLVRKKGHVVLSTPLDTQSVDAFERLTALVQTEFTIIDMRLSYHRLAEACHRFLRMVNRYSPLLEKISYFWWNQDAATHVILLLQRKPLFIPKEQSPLPDRAPFQKERKWE